MSLWLNSAFIICSYIYILRRRLNKVSDIFLNTCIILCLLVHMRKQRITSWGHWKSKHGFPMPAILFVRVWMDDGACS